MVNGCDSALLECAIIIFLFFTFEYSYFLLRTVENGIKIKTVCSVWLLYCTIAMEIIQSCILLFTPLDSLNNVKNKIMVIFFK